MKRMVKADSEYQSFEITVNFGGYIGADETYSVVAKDYEEAKNLALEEAKDDLSAEDINEIDEGEWEVTVGFCGYMGVEESYTVSAEDENEAADAAIDEASWDLEVVEDED